MIKRNMPFAEYQAAPGVSKSLLHLFRDCPLKAFEVATGLVKVKQTRAMLIGTLTDAAIFSPNELDRLYYMEPEIYPAETGIKKWNNNASFCRMWNDQHSDKPIIDQSELDGVKRMVDAVWKEPQAAELLATAAFQVSLFDTDKRTGLARKGRPDGLGDKYILDLKKVADASNRGLSKAIGQYGYYVQAAYYLDLAQSNGRDVCDFYFIAVEPGERPKVNVRRLEQSSIDLGRFVYKRDLDKWAECIKSGVWPSYCDTKEVGPIAVPPWEETNVMGDIPLLNTEEAA